MRIPITAIEERRNPVPDEHSSIHIFNSYSDLKVIPPCSSKSKVVSVKYHVPKNVYIVWAFKSLFPLMFACI